MKIETAALRLQQAYESGSFDDIERYSQLLADKINAREPGTNPQDINAACAAIGVDEEHWPYN